VSYCENCEDLQAKLTETEGKLKKACEKYIEDTLNRSSLNRRLARCVYGLTEAKAVLEMHLTPNSQTIKLIDAILAELAEIEGKK